MWNDLMFLFIFVFCIVRIKKIEEEKNLQKTASKELYIFYTLRFYKIMKMLNEINNKQNY